MKNILKYILKIFSKLILKKYKPEIIAITGSVGKTSSKEAIGQILSKKFRVRRTGGNLNNEIGVPLTIIGFNESPNTSIFGWLKVFWRAIYLLIFKYKKYPSKLIIEMGADHPGDIEYLVNFINIDVAVLTKISQVHLEFFKSIDGVLNEKKKIFSKLTKNSYAVLNNDDEKVASLKNQLNSRVMTYGIKNESDVWATDLQIVKKDDVLRTNFKIRYAGNIVPVFIPDSLGLAQVYAFLSAATIGLIYGINLVEISIFAKDYISPYGRTRLIRGIKDSYIIDDTYNSNPEATKLALDLLCDMKNIIHGKTIAVLGDMLELGSESIVLHREIGQHILEKKDIDYVLMIGENSKHIHTYLEDNNFSNSYYFDNKEKLIEYLKSILAKDSLILVKGSQGARMEFVVKAIMKSPGLASKLLVRQGKEWIK
ncbi:MAG TPA: Mur ligase family protein [bacterium]|nr:Mur ligase family protein [bacterium]HOG38165.1 Mur ligase family protein [bacterium]